MSDAVSDAAREAVPPPPPWRAFSPQAKAAAATRRAQRGEANRPRLALAPVPEPPADDRERSARRRERLRRLLAAFGLSLLLHTLVLTILGLIVLRTDLGERIFTILSPAPGAEADAVFDAVAMPELPESPDTETEVSAAALAAVGDSTGAPDLRLESRDVAADRSEQPAAAEPAPARGPPLRLDDDTAGRDGAAKEMLLKRFGGTPGTEKAVALGLQWLAKVQRSDGSWSFQEVGGAPGAGRFPGNTDNGATASALLCFLGAGHTHAKDGPYKEVVGRGLEYLLANETVTPAGGDYRRDLPHDSHAGMYVQGLAAIALAESAAMTKDARLKDRTDAAVRFILAAQDPVRGGWRYEPAAESDTSVVGWQLMALKSAQMGKSTVPSEAFAQVGRFLDSVAAEEGSQYGYMRPQTGRPSTTAIGLLCRMYLGWDRDNPALAEGVRHLSKLGPSDNDMYANYYATQVLHHWGGEEWERWNRRMRSRLIARQAKAGPHAGSFAPGASISGAVGGRLFETCLSIMTLEVYYRHLPLYDRDKLAVEY